MRQSGKSLPGPWPISTDDFAGGQGARRVCGAVSTALLPRRQGVSHPLHKTVDHLFLAGLLEGDGELVAVDLHHMAVAELLVEDAVLQREFGRGGGFRHQLALDHHGAALVARKAAGRERRLVLAEAAAGLAAAVAIAVGLGALPARRAVAGTEGFDVVEARGAVAAAAPAGAALGFRDLDVLRRQLVEEARGNGGGPGAVDAAVGGKEDFGAAARPREADMGEAALFFQPRAALFV